MLRCSNCREMKPECEFGLDRTSSRGFSYECKSCAKERSKSRKRNRDPVEAKRNNLRRYGLTLEDFNNLVKKQNGCCAICREPCPNLHVDHCHLSFRNRGLLCTSCNKALGFFKDRIDLLEAAIEYLRKHQYAKASLTEILLKLGR